MQKIAQFLSDNLSFDFLGFKVSPSAWRAVAIVILLFLLVLSLAQVRRHFIDWSVKGALFGIFFGFLLALFLEGFLIVGGRTALTEVLGWKNAPKPLQLALDSGRAKLVQVLGMTNAVEILQSLDPTEMKKVKSLICTP